MEFNRKKSIYQQISDLVCENILKGEIEEEKRILSVRDLAVSLEVNPNTVMRAFSHLQDLDIIFNKRGIGYFITSGAKSRVLSLKSSDFIQVELPVIFKESCLYGIGPGKLKELFEEFLKGESCEAK